MVEENKKSTFPELESKKFDLSIYDSITLHVNGDIEMDLLEDYNKSKYNHIYISKHIAERLVKILKKYYGDIK